jgi:hypothetical protein
MMPSDSGMSDQRGGAPIVYIRRRAIPLLFRRDDVGVVHSDADLENWFTYLKQARMIARGPPRGHDFIARRLNGREIHSPENAGPTEELEGADIGKRTKWFGPSGTPVASMASKS